MVVKFSGSPYDDAGGIQSSMPVFCGKAPLRNVAREGEHTLWTW